ncbi:GGDEF domain-containing protein [Aquabacterium sp. A7-Y]|uniref:GGDEF domain-containing protein n=1 Tax=Aquabacterium sp. A7-Y TaxID=1349605 RepID=UPI00223D77C3|nr:GGDEF domain-containing protein [Aquabacterium sp. A7-Y]MCW7541643.1 GGDEF domain-containing protein [Aquabacterium sp. A7-Y]
MGLDDYASTISDCTLALVLLGLMIYVSRLSPGLRGIALWGWAHFGYTIGAALRGVATADLEEGAVRRSLEAVLLGGALLACFSLAGLAWSTASFVRQRALARHEYLALSAGVVAVLGVAVAGHRSQNWVLPQAVQTWTEVVMLGWIAWELRLLKLRPYRVPARLMQAAALTLMVLYALEWLVNSRDLPDQFLINSFWLHVDVSLWFLLNFCMLMLGSFRAIESYQHTANADPLTGLLNRRGLQAALEAHARDRPRARGQAEMLVVLAFDLDHFKRINDRHGHAAGDAVLRRFARSLPACVRTGDLVARLGGEEFLVVCSDIDEAGAMQMAERVRVRAGTLRFTRLPELRVSVSAGVARGVRDEWDELLRRADAALYRAKELGRDRVEMAPPAAEAAASHAPMSPVP